MMRLVQHQRRRKCNRYRQITLQAPGQPGLKTDTLTSFTPAREDYHNRDKWSPA